jgi:hypothetical protein
MKRTAKAWVAAIGGTLTAASTAVASVSVALDDGALDAGDYGAMATAFALLVGTVYGVWRAPYQVSGTVTQDTPQ